METKEQVKKVNMEELSVVGLTQRKESTVHLTTDLSPLRPIGDESNFRSTFDAYPFALVLRLRVLQVVCGISALVMGSVAFIEERRESNLGLGIPAGGATVLAAAASIHTWRGRGRTGAVTGSSRPWLAALKALGPAPLAALWATACVFHLALLVQSIRTMLHPEVKTHSSLSGSSSENNSTSDEAFEVASVRDLTVLAGVQIALTTATLSCVAAVARLDIKIA